jgi:hypothetical protein
MSEVTLTGFAAQQPSADRRAGRLRATRRYLALPGSVHGKPVQGKSRRPTITVVVRIRDVHHFSGKLPVKDLPRIGLRFGKSSRQIRPAPAVIIEASVASVSSKRPVSISALVGLQIGILLGPIAPGNVH